MKKFMFLMAATALLPIFYNTALAERIEGLEITRPVQNADFTQNVDVSRYQTLSVQAVYLDGTPTSTASVTSGTPAVATFTVVRSDVGTAKRASVNITISSNGATGILSGAVVTLNGKTFTEGVDWTVGSSSMITAKSLSNAIEASAQYAATHTLVNTQGAVVIASSAYAGTLSNGNSVTVSTSALTLSQTTLMGGEENGTINIGTMTLTQGVDWTDGLTTALTAKAISNAIVAKMSPLIISTHSAAIIYATSTENGSAYNYSCSGPSSFTIVGFLGGTTPDISITNDTFYEPAHGLNTGVQLQFSTTSPNVAPGGLRNGVTYYAIRQTDDYFKLSDTSTGSAAGISINVTSLPLSVTASTYSFLPGTLSTATGNGFFWQASNDGANYATINTSSVTYSTPGTTVWDFTNYAYKYLRINFKGPSFGSISLNVRLYGNRN